MLKNRHLEFVKSVNGKIMACFYFAFDKNIYIVVLCGAEC